MTFKEERAEEVIEIEISPSGEIISSWWSKEIEKLFCAICGKNCTQEGMINICLVKNQFCG